MRATLLVLLACFCFGTLGTAQELADLSASPLSVGLSRVLLGGLLLALMIRMGPGASFGQTSGSNQLSRTPLAALSARGVVGIGAVGVLAYQPLFFIGTETNGVTIGSVVALGSAPVVAGLIDGILRRQLPHLPWVCATAVSVIGVTMVSGVFETSLALGGVGILWSVSAGACYAIYTLAAKDLLDRGWSSQRTMGLTFGLAAAISLPILAFVGAQWIFTPRGIVLLLWLGVIGTALGYFLFGRGLASLPATTVTTLTLAEPLCAALLGIGVLHERLNFTATSGLLVLAAGLTFLTVSHRTRAIPG